MTRFSLPVRISSTAAYWPVRPMDARTRSGSLRTSIPATSAYPASGLSNVVRMRTVVVLPAPFGPSNPSTDPVGTSRSTPARASVSPNRFFKPSARTASSPSKRWLPVMCDPVPIMEYKTLGTHAPGSIHTRQVRLQGTSRSEEFHVTRAHYGAPPFLHNRPHVWPRAGADDTPYPCRDLSCGEPGTMTSVVSGRRRPRRCPETVWQRTGTNHFLILALSFSTLREPGRAGLRW